MNAIYLESNDGPVDAIADTKAFLSRCHARREAKNGKPGAPTIARKYVQVDVIAVEPNGHGIGWPSFECEIGFAHTEHRSHLTLVQFAQQHFGTGTLRKIGVNRYVVLQPAALPVSVWGAEFDGPRAAA
jgi:hypothetical protein